MTIANIGSLPQWLIQWISGLTLAGVGAFVAWVWSLRKINAEIRKLKTETDKIKAETDKIKADTLALQYEQKLDRLMNKLVDCREMPEKWVCETFPAEDPELVREALSRLKREVLPPRDSR